MTELITDEQELLGARTRFDNPIKTYDDGFGPLWVYRESLGVVGVVRAQNWESADSIVGDEILTPIPEDDMIEAYGFYVIPEEPLNLAVSRWWDAMKGDGEHLARFKTEQEAMEHCARQIVLDQPDLVDGYKFQDNATGSGIVLEDVNGSSLDLLTPELLHELQITLQIEVTP